MREKIDGGILDNILVKRLDGKYEERLDDGWIAEYFEDPDTGLWTVEIFQHSVAEWRSMDYSSLEEAQEAAHNYFDQL